MLTPAPMGLDLSVLSNSAVLATPAYQQRQCSTSERLLQQREEERSAGWPAIGLAMLKQAPMSLKCQSCQIVLRQHFLQCQQRQRLMCACIMMSAKALPES